MRTRDATTRRRLDRRWLALLAACGLFGGCDRPDRAPPPVVQDRPPGLPERAVLHHAAPSRSPSPSPELRAAARHARVVADPALRRALGRLTAREADAALAEVHRRLLGWLERRPDLPDAAVEGRLRPLLTRLRDDPRRFLRWSGVLRVRGCDVEVWTRDFRDALWDGPVPAAVLDSPVDRRRALHLRAERAARQLLTSFLGTRYRTLAAKERALREALVGLRGRLLRAAATEASRAAARQ